MAPVRSLLRSKAYGLRRLGRADEKNKKKIISKKKDDEGFVEPSGRVEHERRRLRVASSRRCSVRKMMGFVAPPFEGLRASSLLRPKADGIHCVAAPFEG